MVKSICRLMRLYYPVARPSLPKPVLVVIQVSYRKNPIPFSPMAVLVKITSLAGTNTGITQELMNSKKI